MGHFNIERKIEYSRDWGMDELSYEPGMQLKFLKIFVSIILCFNKLFKYVSEIN